MGWRAFWWGRGVQVLAALSMNERGDEILIYSRYRCIKFQLLSPSHLL